jgi:hypothetical protein
VFAMAGQMISGLKFGCIGMVNFYKSQDHFQSVKQADTQT